MQLIVLSASANKLAKLKEQAEEYASLIMEELDPENLGYIEVHQFLFLAVFSTYTAALLSFRLSVNYCTVFVLYSSVLTRVLSLSPLASCGSWRRCSSSATPT
jgi:hypothetical protein